MKIAAIVLISLFVLTAGGGVWWWMTKDDGSKANVNQVVVNTNTTTNTETDTTLSNTNSTPLPAAPEPLANWNTEWRADPIYLSSVPTSLAEGQTMCETVSKNGCYQELALGFRDAVSCGKITNTPAGALSLTTYEEDLSSCFKQFQLIYNVFDCSIYTDSTVSDQCYLAFAIFPLENKTLDCSMIVSPSTKTTCESSVATLQQIDNTFNEITDAFTKVQASMCYLFENPNIVDAFPSDKIKDDANTTLQSTTQEDCRDISAESLATVGSWVTVDADNDQLTLFLENIYLTSDLAADTDSDGYDDLTEINGGYDPNGPGKL